MELHVLTNLEDYKALQQNLFKRIKYAASCKKKNCGMRLLYLWLLFLGFFVIFKTTGLNTISAELLLPGLVIGLLFPILFLIFYLKRLSQYYPNPKGLILGNQTIKLTEYGIEQEGEHFTAQYSWSLLEHISETDQHIFVYLDRISALILPIRSFESVDKQLFLAELRKHTKNLINK